MNDLSTLNIKESYDSGYDNILWDFYIPVLSEANQYDRIAGFFSSSSLALAARGMQQFIEHGGRMRLVTCPKFSKRDAEMLEQSAKGMDDVLTDEDAEDPDDLFAEEEDSELELMTGFSRDDLELMDADERAEVLGDAGYEPDDFGFDDF